jgi:hypothetical protein
MYANIDDVAIAYIQANIYWRNCGGVFVPEVLSGLGDSLAVKSNDNTTKLLIAMRNVKVDLSQSLAPVLPHPKSSPYLVGDLGALGRLGGLRKEDERNREDQKNRNNESLEGSHDDWSRCDDKLRAAVGFICVSSP